MVADSERRKVEGGVSVRLVSSIIVFVIDSNLFINCQGLRESVFVEVNQEGWRGILSFSSFIPPRKSAWNPTR